MNEIFSFFNNVILGKDNGSMKIGLSQFKDKKEEKPVVKKAKSLKTERKLSDLMGGM